ncbi:hypothetical protein ABAC402_07650 [Asticcacaulis sp. AC402]|nr:hypothetical protein ABAC402_07650 [Asticcacaulis sp. AC402]
MVVEPRLGGLTQLDAAAATPSGLVSVSYSYDTAKRLKVTIAKPEGLPGVFVWKERDGADRIAILLRVFASPRSFSEKWHPLYRIALGTAAKKSLT